MDTIGLSFQPGAEDEEQKKRASMIPQAIKVLSLRLPRILGAQAPTAEALLRPQAGSGGGGPMANAVVQSILRSMGTPGAAPQAAPMQAPITAAGGGGGEAAGLQAAIQQVGQMFGKPPAIQYQDNPVMPPRSPAAPPLSIPGGVGPGGGGPFDDVRRKARR